jgi:hypothetical protein
LADSFFYNVHCDATTFLWQGVGGMIVRGSLKKYSAHTFEWEAAGAPQAPQVTAYIIIPRANRVCPHPNEAESQNGGTNGLHGKTK